ncbi:MAG: class II D-tagatose-bisphosphate aldolase, non-catalytic subunit [Maritimibacter sp.]|nr:class II D-tagatose-bisphosphate aldolase, non-catalytic subunit [Maritimibacter sp.]
MTALDSYRDILRHNRERRGGGVASICSAHPLVLRALFRSALKRDTIALVESTSNQVDQFGGYTGMTPADFVDLVHALADAEGFPRDRLLLGGDHLGPNSWRAEGPGAAMAKTRDLVEAYVRAGYRKIHLDASFVCAGDPASLTDEIVAARAAEMAEVAEASWEGTPPVYIVGTEVPTPGGIVDAEEMHVTRPEDVRRTLAAFEAAFRARGLDAAWERVTGLVVQPGVEFGDGRVEDYAGAPELSKTILDYPGMVFEAHSTDYQTPANLSRLVADHFCILKVGPWLTYALREGLMALELIERELAPDRPARFREVLTGVMKDMPKYWAPYYSGDPSEVDFKLIYSYSDRARYYLPQQQVKAAIDRLLANLAPVVPEALLSQYLPAQYRAVRAGDLEPAPEALLISRISEVIDVYLDA